MDKKPKDRVNAGFGVRKIVKEGRSEPEVPKGKSKPWQPPSKGSAPENRKK